MGLHGFGSSPAPQALCLPRDWENWVLPGHVVPTLLQHWELPPLHPSLDGRGGGSFYLLGFEEGVENPSLE